MTHTFMHSDAYPPRHPGTTHAGNVGFYAVVGIVAVSVLILLGLYVVAQDALQGLADLARNAAS